jgi:uncharacterized protein
MALGFSTRNLGANKFFLYVEVPVMTDGRSLEFHIITSDDMNVLFHPLTFTLLKVGRRAADILRDYEQGHDLGALAEKHGCTPDEVSSLLKTLEESVQQPLATPIEVNPLSGNLTLLISRDCNLRCQYCYADGGSYQKGRMLMSRETALQALELFTRSEQGFQFREIIFFGGEPTLNIPVIRAVCEYLREAVETGCISKFPGLGMVTNGTRVSDEFCALVADYNIQVTVSLDGPAQINDRLRVNVAGQGTYQIVAGAIQRLQRATQGREPSVIECTVTRHHLEMGITYDDLARFFSDTLGIRQHHIVPVLEWSSCGLGLSEADLTAWETAMQNRFVSALAEGSLQISRLGTRAVHILNTKQFNPYLCVAGVTSVTIDSDGAIYPCYTLNNAACYMGNISDPGVLDSSRFNQILESFVSNSKPRHPQCTTCWVRGLCSGCYGHMYLETGSPHDRVDAICTRRKIAGEALLLDLARLRTDKTKWQRALQTVRTAPPPQLLEEESLN